MTQQQLHQAIRIIEDPLMMTARRAILRKIMSSLYPGGAWKN